MTSCNTMWSVAQNNQIISMKMCVETVLSIMPLVNITNLTTSSLQNATLNSTKNVSFISNILNHTNNTQYFPIVNATNTSNTNKTVNISYYTPSPEPNITIEAIEPINPSPYTPSPSKISSYIRGTGTPSPTIISIIPNNRTNYTNNSTLPSVLDNESNTVLAIIAIVSSIILTFGLLLCLIKRRNKTNKIHNCTTLTSHYKDKKPEPLKRININKNIFNRPRDYIIETMSDASTPKTNPNAPREAPEESTREVPEELDTDDTTTLE